MFINISIYFLFLQSNNINSINSKSTKDLTKIKKYIMNNPIYSIDIDTELDFTVAESISKKII